MYCEAGGEARLGSVVGHSDSGTVVIFSMRCYMVVVLGADFCCVHCVVISSGDLSRGPGGSGLGQGQEAHHGLLCPHNSVHHLCHPGVHCCPNQHGVPHDSLVGLREQGAAHYLPT